MPDRPVFGPIESYAYYEEVVTVKGVKIAVVSRRPIEDVLRDWKIDALRRHRQRLQELRRRPLRPNITTATQTPVLA